MTDYDQLYALVLEWRKENDAAAKAASERAANRPAMRATVPIETEAGSPDIGTITASGVGTIEEVVFYPDELCQIHEDHIGQYIVDALNAAIYRASGAAAK